VKSIRNRLTYANVMSSIAVFLVLGGATAFAASKIGAKQLQSNSVTTAKIKKNAVTNAKIKKDAVTGAKVKDQSLTGSDINLGTLGKVPSAASADNATNLTGFKVFSGRGANESVTPLLNTGQFEVVGLCDPAGTLVVPGFENGYNTRHGEAIGIINRGQDNGWADTSDDDDEVFNMGEGVAFDYSDVNDGGSAVLPNGHWIEVLGGAVTNAAGNPNFGTGCSFHGLAWFG
jgi:hypothetical protein